MWELFDLISGTSNSAILAAALSVRKEVDKNVSFYAKEIIDLFLTEGANIYPRKTINYGLLGIITFVCALIGGVLGHRLGKRIFVNRNVEMTLSQIRRFYRKREKELHEEEMEGHIKEEEKTNDPERFTINEARDVVAKNTKLNR